ncbi:MAG: metal-sensitive transcriptional regulator [Parasphingorhabdus sp.]|uniref:metal-sensitive transcriptional regulator n=1 Tax=Parasphingorhabdus sp. TaxID=2709688 RepID=UPI0030036A12
MAKGAVDQKINRLRRIEGQVRGIAQMVTDDRYCMDILHQVQAVKSALAKVESQILKDHAACCVQEAISSGDAAQQKEKFDELVDLFEKVKR